MFKEMLKQEVKIANAQIDALELITHVVAPENMLSDIITFDNPSEDELNQIQLKRTYQKKRKLLFFLDQFNDNISFACHVCGKDVEIERLLLMPKARLCMKCAK